jgi:DMSO reductase family type II enzyme chaperone
MTVTIVDDLTTIGQPISPRGDTYLLLSHAISFPDARLHNRVLAQRWACELYGALGRLPCRFPLSRLNWTVPDHYDDMQSDYIRLFQVGGRRGPPCPLHEGHYTRDRGQTLQHLIRFYNYFGFRTIECVMPDHLPVQLEFMSELCRIADESEDPGALRAQRDFIRRHLSWVENLRVRVNRSHPPPFYRSLIDVTARLIAADDRLIAARLEEEPHG